MKKKIFGCLVMASMLLSLLVACAPAQVTASPIAVDTESTIAPVVETMSVPIKIKVALFPYSSYAPLYYAQAEGYYKEQGLDVEFVDFKSQSDAIVALASGQVDVSGGVLDAASLTAISEGTGLKIVADKGYIDPSSTCPYSAWMARKDLLDSGELNDISQIKGKKVAFPKTSFFEYAMDKLLSANGLDTNDIEIVDIPAPTRLEALSTGAVDIAQMGEPWITRTLAAGSATTWYPFEESLPNAQFAVIWYGPSITIENPDAGNRFMVAYMQAVQQYNQGKTDRNVELMAEFTKSTPEDASASCWLALTKDGNINVEFVLDFQQWALGKGYIDGAMTVDEFWDGSFLEYAHKHLP